MSSLSDILYYPMKINSGDNYGIFKSTINAYYNVWPSLTFTRQINTVSGEDENKSDFDIFGNIFMNTTVLSLELENKNKLKNIYEIQTEFENQWKLNRPIISGNTGFLTPIAKFCI